MTDEGSTEPETELEPDPEGEPGAAAGPYAASAPAAPESPKITLASRVWVSIGVAVIVLVLLIIFIAENSHDVTVTFLGAKGTISLGLAMLIAAVAGVVITLLVGTTRIVQLRREVRRHNRRARAGA